MGRYKWSNRKTVEDCLVIDITFLSKKRCLYNGMQGSITWESLWGEVRNSVGISVVIPVDQQQQGFVWLSYATTHWQSENRSEQSYSVRLESTSCHYGGKRFWFTCPLLVNSKPCERRVGKLYLLPGGKYFGCRHCWNLTYKCQKEHDKRVDALLRNPLALLKSRPETRDFYSALLTMKALQKFERKIKS